VEFFWSAEALPPLLTLTTVTKFNLGDGVTA
jgi:hypothetical protein